MTKTDAKADLHYLLQCVKVHADKFPAPSHMRELVARVLNDLAARQPEGWRLVPEVITERMQLRVRSEMQWLDEEDCQWFWQVALENAPSPVCADFAHTVPQPPANDTRTPDDKDGALLKLKTETSWTASRFNPPVTSSAPMPSGGARRER